MPFTKTRIEPSPESDWIALDDFISGENGCFDFFQIMLEFYGPLTEAEISCASGCLGYALREVLAGEDLSDPEIRYTGQSIRLCYYYDSTKSLRDDPNHFAAFEKAKQYISEGSPVRKTNRAGYNTKGTRLVEGIGPRRIDIFVR